MTSPKQLLYPLLLLSIITCNSCQFFNSHNQYSCTPCGYDCDKAFVDHPGKCPECKMDLVQSSSIVFKTIGAGRICSYLETHPTTILLDVRTKEEFEGKASPDFGTLKNAMNIPVQELGSRLDELYAYKTKEIIVYCSHSHRSPRAAYLLTQHGFTNIINMEGGMSVMSDPSCKK